MSDGCYRSDNEISAFEKLPYWEQQAIIKDRQIASLQKDLSMLAEENKKLKRLVDEKNT